jgi:cytochrome P450
MTHELIDNVIDRGGCDFLAEVAEPLPVTLFMQMAGMPTGRLAEFRVLAEEATASAEGSVRQKAFVQIGEILAEVIRARQVERRDDLISRLLDARIDGNPPTFTEMVNYAVLLFLGGLETVVNAISWGMRHLAIDQALQAQVRAQPELITPAVEEILRLYAVASTVRRVTTGHSIRDVKFETNDSVLLLIPAVNYDPAAYKDPGACILGRPEPHVTFNSGPHRCLGANLARLELRTFFTEWLQRVPPHRLDPERPATFVGGLNLGVRSLPLLW